MRYMQGIGGAKVFERGEFLTDAGPSPTEPGKRLPGKFSLSIIRTLVKQTQKSGVAFIAEMVVVESNTSAHPVGANRTWFQSFKSPQIAMGAIKAFTAAALGVATNDADGLRGLESTIEGVMSEVEEGHSNPLEGLTVDVTCRLIQTEKTGSDFTVHDWAPSKYANPGAIANVRGRFP